MGEFIQTRLSRRAFLASAAAGSAAVIAGGVRPVGAEVLRGGSGSRPWFDATVPELQASMASGELSSRRLTGIYLRRIERFNPMLGAVIEEALFRVVLFWRWAQARADGAGRLPVPGTVLRLAVVSAYFAALHLPQPPWMLGVALLGALVAGAALLRWRSFALVATLHALFNAHSLL